MAHGGYYHHAFSPAPFRTHGIAFSVLGFGVVNAFGGFSGFEGAATLGEESARSQRTIPMAVAGSLALSAGVYIVFTWIVDNAYATPTGLAADPAPLVHLASINVGSAMGKLVNVAGVISAFGALARLHQRRQPAAVLGRSRGRRRPAGTQPAQSNQRPPRVADRGLLVTGSVSLAALLAFSFEKSAIRALIFIIQYGAYLILGVYLLTMIAAMVLVWRYGRRPVPLLVLGLGVAVLVYGLCDTFIPLPAGPFGVVALAAVGSTILGIGFALIPAVHQRLGASKLLRAVRGERSPEPAVTSSP